MSNTLDTPILFLIFNRLDTTKQVFSQIKKQKPKFLYLASDGGRDNREQCIVDDVRDYVLSHIDWDCEVIKLFRDHNLGCKLAVSDAITWFFDQEEYGIILEDDCLPSDSFFNFCQEGLRAFQDDETKYQIAGFNHLEEVCDVESDYFICPSFCSIWGWASWRRAWEKYHVSPSWDSRLENRKSNDEKIIVKDHKKKIRAISNGFDTWDYQWDYAIFKNRGEIVYPKKSLVKNIGIGESGTHTKNTDDPLNRVCSHEMEKISFTSIKNNYSKDFYQYRLNEIKKTYFYNRVKRKLSKVFGYERV